MRVRRTVLSTAVALAALLPSGSAHATCVVDPPVPCTDEVWEAFDAVVRLLNTGCDRDLCVPPYPWWDMTVCPVLASLAPGVAQVAEIRPDGDLYVDGHLVQDCPPYEPWEGRR